jgi:hypothetical protein
MRIAGSYIVSSPREHMLRIACALLLLAAAIAAAPLQAQDGAEVLRAVARIEQVVPGADANRAIIVRRRGGRRTARPYDYLFAGDRLLLTGQSTSVVIRRAGIAGTETLYAERNAVVTFGASQGPTMSARFGALVAGLAYWWRDGNRGIPTEAVARSLDPQSFNIAGRPPMPLRAVLARGQKIDVDRTLVVPVWAGDAVRLTVADAGGAELRRSLVIGKYATRVPLDVRVPRASFVLAGTGDLSVRIEITRTRAPPLPAWIGAIRDASEARLAAAAWLAIEGPAEWRLEGYSRLTELAERDLAAQSVWEAVTMEWVIGRRR